MDSNNDKLDVVARFDNMLPGLRENLAPGAPATAFGATIQSEVSRWIEGACSQGERRALVQSILERIKATIERSPTLSFRSLTGRVVIFQLEGRLASTELQSQGSCTRDKDIRSQCSDQEEEPEEIVPSDSRENSGLGCNIL